MDYELALCSQTDPDLFFPDKARDGDLVRVYQQAKAICAVCPLITECLEQALTTKVQTADGYEIFVLGVWGGTTEKERREIRKKRNIV
jgi:WhiB family redox-sensing transcriptional regulator